MIHLKAVGYNARPTVNYAYCKNLLNTVMATDIRIISLFHSSYNLSNSNTYTISCLASKLIAMIFLTFFSFFDTKRLG